MAAELSAKAFSDQIRARIFDLIAETRSGDVVAHCVTAINEAIAKGTRVTGSMLMAMPLYRAVPGYEDRVIRHVELLHRIEDQLAYLGISWEPVE